MICSYLTLREQECLRVVRSAQEDELQSNEFSNSEASGEEAAAHSEHPESYFSNHSSFADVSMADGQSPPPETVNQVSNSLPSNSQLKPYAAQKPRKNLCKQGDSPMAN